MYVLGTFIAILFMTVILVSFTAIIQDAGNYKKRDVHLISFDVSLKIDLECLYCIERKYFVAQLNHNQ